VALVALAVAQTSLSQEPKKTKTYPDFGADPYAADEIEAAREQAKEARTYAEAARKEAEKQMNEARKQADSARKEAEKQWRIESDKFKFVFNPFGREAHAKLREAAEAVRDAEDGKDREQAASKLRELLEDSFAEDMKRREESLEEMKDRLNKLEEQLDRRRDKMEEIVELQMKVLVNEADGLGFFSGGASTFEAPIITHGQNTLFAPPPGEPFAPGPIRISAPMPAPAIEALPAAAPIGPGAPAPPVSVDPDREREDRVR
jgi:multidrug efflux pump subunit AcrA (membrane-fusion protein)